VFVSGRSLFILSSRILHFIFPSSERFSVWRFVKRSALMFSAFLFFFIRAPIWIRSCSGKLVWWIRSHQFCSPPLDLLFSLFKIIR